MIVIIPAYEPDYRLENLVKSLKKEKNLKAMLELSERKEI